MQTRYIDCTEVGGTSTGAFEKTTSSIIGNPFVHLLNANNIESNAPTISKNDILDLKRKSLRKGVWFRGLSKMERGIIDLTVRCVERIRSPTLIRVLQRVLNKLSDAVKHPFAWRIEQIGRPLADRAIQVALSWGVEEAVSWKEDVSYVRCLGLNYLSSYAWR